MQLSDLVQGHVFAFLLIFCRIGAALMVVPGIGDVHIQPRARLVIALALSLILLPVLLPQVPPLTDQVAELVRLVSWEVITGLFMGTLTRMILVCVEVAGSIIAGLMSLTNAIMPNPVALEQGSLVGVMFSMVAVLLIFVTNLHHLFIWALVQSYDVFIVNTPPAWEDMANTMARVVTHGFLMAIQMASPFLVIGMVFMLALGLLGRLMPQLQVFFIILPLQVSLGFLILMSTMGAALLWFLNVYQATIENYLLPG